MTADQRIQEMKDLAMRILDHAEKLSKGVGSGGVEPAPKKLSEADRLKILQRRDKGR